MLKFVKLAVFSGSLQFLTAGIASAQDSAYALLECASNMLVLSTIFETNYYQGLDAPSLPTIHSIVLTAGGLVTLVEEEYGDKMNVARESKAVLDGVVRGFEITSQKYGSDFATISVFKRDQVCREKFSEPLKRAREFAREQAND